MKIMLYFFPCLVLFPFFFFGFFEELFLDSLVWGIEKCGSVFIKLA
jgi:hypothetical protein